MIHAVVKRHVIDGTQSYVNSMLITVTSCSQNAISNYFKENGYFISRTLYKHSINSLSQPPIYIKYTK